MSLNQRADDADVLCDIVRVTGLGRLYAVPARRGSRPQVVWSVASKLECERRLHALRRHRASRFATLCRPGHARGAEEHVPTPPDDGLSAFLGGFFTGEGTFSLQGRAMAGIHLRADDLDLVRSFGYAFRIGRVSVATPTGVTPTVRWTVCRRTELREAIAMLDAAVLRGRKRREFEAWRIGAAEYARGRDRDETVIAAAAESLARARAYANAMLRKMGWRVRTWPPRRRRSCSRRRGPIPATSI